MGIPYYFATLLKNHAGICSVLKQRHNVDFFGIDFNCLIHRYLKDENPIGSVLDALDSILEYICSGNTVYIAMDGLVPYAKIVQQRYRRFKIKEEGIFDRNQISPDTPYMRELEQGIRSRFPNIILSPTQESGEGEHKIFHEIRKQPRTSICIYGLDADLILLSLYNSSPNFTLLRESSEFNDIRLNSEFSLLSIPKLLNQIPIPLDQYLHLSILCFGNDFMPNIGIFSLREDGYSRALEMLRKSKADLTTSDGRFQFLSFASKHEIEILQERIKLRRRPAERGILGKNIETFSHQYGLHILDGVRDMEPVVEAFWKTFHWTVHYFKYNEVLDWSWVYPYADAPLLQDIVQFYESEPSKHECTFQIIHQLQFILPAKSLRKAKRRVIYEDEFYTETRLQWMKRHDWETKPYMSLPWTNATSVSLH